jgi:hypothetical protein
VKRALGWISIGTLLLAAVVTTAAQADSWAFVGTNAVASSPTAGGGYPVPPGHTRPDPGTCRPGAYNSNRSESWIAVKPGSEDLVGASKFFFETFSTFYIFHLGSYRVVGGVPVDNNQVQGYDCVSTGTQEMPPSWTDNTDPNVDFDTKGRAYQVTLPFNAFWEGGLHPNAEVDISYSDDMGQHWTRGNGGKPLEPTNNQTSLAFGHVEDKQWVAVNHIPGNANQDHVYAAWAVFNGSAVKVRMAVSRDRGQTFAKAQTIASPSEVSAGATYVYPSVDAAGDVYVAVVSFPPNGRPSKIFVARSDDDGRSFGPFVAVATVGALPTAGLPNTRFRDGITESFTASPTYPGHLYVTYEDWDGSQMDVKLTQSTDGGATWSPPVVVNDNSDPAGQATDQFQPSVAAGPGGAVAVAFYDRRRPCPNDGSILPPDVGRANFCIDTTLQAYKDSGSGAVAVGANVRMSEFSWDPEQPGQHVGGVSQYPCAGHTDPCPNGRGFIGDYFGLAVSSQSIYGLFVSTHYPSAVTADEGGAVYYQQQVLATVPRTAIGAGY